MAAQRSLGVTLSAITSIAGSALVALSAAAMLMGTIVQQPQPNQPFPVKAVGYILCLFFAGLSAWGITTAVGLFRLRHWSRISILLFSGLLVVTGPLSAIAVGLTPLPNMPTASSGLIGIVRGVIISFYALIGLLGACWLFYFTRPGVRLQFGAEGAQRDRRRPLSVSIIACFFLAGALFGLLGAVLFPVPQSVLGLVLRGWPARLLTVVYATLSLWIGLGLLRLNPLSRAVAIAYAAFASLNSVIFVALPDFQERMRAFQDTMPAAFHRPSTEYPSALMRSSMIAGALVCLIPIWFLVARRAAFKDTEPSAAA